MKRTRLKKRQPPEWVTEKADRAEERLAHGTVRDMESTGNPYLDAMVRRDIRRPKRDRRGRRSRVEDYKKEREEPTGDPLDAIDHVTKMGRPAFLKDDPATRTLIAGLASIQCSKHEAAAVFGISWHTFHNYLNRHPEVKELWENGVSAGRASLRRKQFNMADKSAPMAIWLGKQYLDQRDKVDVAGPNGGPLQSVTVDAAELAKLSPRQREALQKALQIIRPEMFESAPIEAEEVKQIEYDPDS